MAVIHSRHPEAGTVRIDEAACDRCGQCAIVDADFEESDFETIRNALGRLGVADVRAFGLLWEDCEAILRQLGFTVRLEIVAA